MVHLNRHRLTARQHTEMFLQLNQVIYKLGTRFPNNFLNELLGEEEQVMLSKRLAIVVLLLENKSLYAISNMVKVSSATVKKLKHQLDTGQFSRLVGLLGKSKKNYFEILEAIDSILHLGGVLPHYNGLDRYRF